MTEIFLGRAVAVAQLAERSPPTPEIRRSNPVIGKTLFDCQLYFNSEKTKINEKEAGMARFFKCNGSSPVFIRVISVISAMSTCLYPMPLKNLDNIKILPKKHLGCQEANSGQAGS